MAKKKKYKVKGTKDFLILTVICAVFFVWSLRDGWFPSDKTLRKHPPELVLSFAVDGVITSVDAVEGRSVGPGAPLAKLGTATKESRFKKLEEEYAVASNAGDEKLMAEKMQELLALRKLLESAELKVAEGYLIELNEAGRPIIAASYYDKLDQGYNASYHPDHAVIKEVLIKRNRRAAKGEPAVVLNTKDHFYPFNKVLAIITLIAFVVFGILHILASRD